MEEEQGEKDKLLPSLELKLDGGLIKDHKVSLRVLGNILPDFQRSFDKIVILELEGKFKRGRSIPKKDRNAADFYIDRFREGSLIIPLCGAVKEQALRLYKWAIKEPYEKARLGEEEIAQELVARKMEAQQKAGEFEIRFQEDVVKEATKDHKKFARAAALSDLHHALDTVRRGGDNNLSIDFVRPGLEESFPFDSNQAIRFGKIVYKNYLTKPAIYKGKIRGTRERSGVDGFKYEADLYSSYSHQNMTVYVRTEEQVKTLAQYAYGDEISFWASPLERYGGFDPYNGSVVFINMCE